MGAGNRAAWPAVAEKICAGPSLHPPVFIVYCRFILNVKTVHIQLKSCFSLLAVVWVTASFGQAEIQKTFDAGGNLKTSVPLVNGKKHGIEKNYSGGVLYSEVSYKDGIKDGYVKTYYSDGSLSSSCIYVNGKQEGSYKNFYQSGKLKDEIPFVHGERQGIQKSYFENGNLSKEVPMVDGWIEGVEKEYWENGSLKSAVSRKRSTKDGLSVEYYRDGSVKSEARYKMGVLQGQVNGYSPGEKTTAGDLCSDLEKIIGALRQGKLSALVDYNKPLGFTRSWYEATVPLAGFNRLKGQNLLGSLSFAGTLVNGYGDGKEKEFEKIAAALGNCLSGYTKKVEQSKDSPVRFTTYESQDKKITVVVEYSYSGNDEKGIYLAIRNH
jgi:antitoxin component YwqK of YwqJK toxin-antitoxin module